jgi:glycosyltransferase involved in cell wall biosynthesis
MERILFWMGVLNVIAALGLLRSVLTAERRLVRLADVALPPGEAPPSVTVVVAARDEARGIEAALRSVLAQDHPAMDVVVVDDRSTDGTGDILRRMVAAEPRLRVVSVDTLPDGWLGKCHALWRGSQEAAGELLLFADADVVMRPDTVRRAATHLARAGRDHVTLGMRLEMPGVLLKAFGVLFGILFTEFSKPWRVTDPKRPEHVGIGAFNLVRASAYRAVGGHVPIALRPDDDMKLGKLLKKNGFRQELLDGSDHISVAWYHSVREAVRGLRKNAFAGVDYRYAPLVGGTVANVLFLVVPFVAVFVAPGAARWTFAAAVGALLLLFARAARPQRVPAWMGVALPAASLLFCFVLWNAVAYTLIHRGIEWRGTHYPLDALRANRV